MEVSFVVYKVYYKSLLKAMATAHNRGVYGVEDVQMLCAWTMNVVDMEQRSASAVQYREAEADSAPKMAVT